MNLRHLMLTLFIGIFMIAACQRQSITTDAPSNPVENPHGKFDLHSHTAFADYPRALEDALRWNPKAELVQIAPTGQMRLNLGVGGGVGREWFYMFKLPDSPLEFFVAIDEGTIYGRTEAQPLLIEELPYVMQVIKLDGLIDSDEALRQYLNNGGDKYLADNPDVKLDFRLIYLQNTPNPVWSIFSDKDYSDPLYNLDAVTKEAASDPFSEYK